MWKYAYYDEWMAAYLWRGRCNELGAEGWSLQWMRFDDVQDRIHCFFKRTISNREQAAEAFSLLSDEAKQRLGYVPPSLPAPAGQGGRPLMRIQIDVEGDREHFKFLLTALSDLAVSCLMDRVPLAVGIDGDLVNEIIVKVCPKRAPRAPAAEAGTP